MNLTTQIARGNTASIYLHEGKIIKVFNDYLPSTEALYEATKQKYAYSCGLPVPKVFDVIEIDGKQAIIMEYIQGRTIGDIIFKDMERAEYYMSIAVDIQQKIHAIDADSIEPMSEKLSRQIQSANILGDERKSILLQKLNAITSEKKLCHGDYHVFNLIMTNDDVIVIDWVDSSIGDIRADVYRSYLLYSQISMELADLYLRLYCEKSGLSKDEVFLWAPIIAGARLSENVSTEKIERLLEIINKHCPL